MKEKTKQLFENEIERAANKSFNAGAKGNHLPTFTWDNATLIERYIEGVEDRVSRLSVAQDSGYHVPQREFERAGQYMDFARSCLTDHLNSLDNAPQQATRQNRSMRMG